jgi:hypothetical protein
MLGFFHHFMLEKMVECVVSSTFVFLGVPLRFPILGICTQSGIAGQV